jgi:hypothetical protein
MQTIKPTTKEGRAYMERYNRATAQSIYEAYKTPSTNKTRADYFCRAQMAKENGHGYRVISYNCFHFSVAWQTAQGLRIETPARSILVTL